MTNDGKTGLERVTSGISGLDTILNGGFLVGGLYIVQGPPGTGKTTFANQLSFHHAAGGGKSLYVTLLAEYHARMMQHLSTMSFFDVAKIPDQISYLNGLQILHDEGLKGLLTLLRREITANGASVLVLDGLVAARNASQDDQAFNEFVHELQAIAIATDCTVFMLASSKDLRVSPEHTMVDGIIELSDRTAGWASEGILHVLKFRGSAVLRGWHSLKITGDGLVVHPRIESLFARPSQPGQGTTGRVSTGIDRLDSLLGGGLPGASTAIVMGPSGIGKTTLGLQFLSGSSEAEPGLMFGFYETTQRLNAKIDGVCPRLRPLVDSGIVQLHWQPPTDDQLDAYGERLLDLVQSHKIKRLFIDGLGALQGTVGADRERIGKFITALMNELRVRGVTTLYALEVTGVVDASVQAPMADLSSLGENLILLRYVERGIRLHRVLSIIKVRDSAFDSSLYEYTTSSQGLLIAENSDSAAEIMNNSNRRQPGDRSPRRHLLERLGR